MTTHDLYRDFRKPLLAFIRAKLRDQSKAEDILHDVFLRVHAHIADLNDVAKIESWIYQIARNRIADDFRTEKSVTALNDETDFAEPESNSALLRLANSARRFAAQLPEPHRTALMLADFENLPQREVARRLGISLSAAKSRVQRARKLLKELYLECCTFEQNAHRVILDYEPRANPSDCDAC